jgi:hypothetical protein
MDWARDNDCLGKQGAVSERIFRYEPRDSIVVKITKQKEARSLLILSHHFLICVVVSHADMVTANNRRMVGMAEHGTYSTLWSRSTVSHKHQHASDGESDSGLVLM